MRAIVLGMTRVPISFTPWSKKWMSMGAPRAAAAQASSESVKPSHSSPLATLSRTTELPSTKKTPRSFNCVKKTVVLSFPISAQSAATWVAVVPNKGNAMPIFSAGNCLSIRSSIDTWSVLGFIFSRLLIRTLARPPKAFHRFSGSCHIL